MIARRASSIRRRDEDAIFRADITPLFMLRYFAAERRSNYGYARYCLYAPEGDIAMAYVT